MKNFTELDVWIKAKDLAVLTYKLTNTFPRIEQYRLTDQLTRCSVSISSNIAEGIGRKSIKDRSHFFYIARGSAFELESQMIIANELGYIENQVLEEIIAAITSVKKLINGFIAFLNAKAKPDTKN